MSIDPTRKSIDALVMPEIDLPDVGGRRVRLAEYRNIAAYLLVHLRAGCPEVQRIRSDLAILAREYLERDVAVIGLNACDPRCDPPETVDAMAEEIVQGGYSFPYLVDKGRRVLDQLGATRTPECFVFDSEGRLTYRGPFDAGASDNGRPADPGALREALDAALAARKAAGHGRSVARDAGGAGRSRS